MTKRVASSTDTSRAIASVPWVAYWNGALVNDDEVHISPWDRGYMMADAVYEATRTFRHSLFHLDWHLDRLFRSLDYLKLDPGLSRSELETVTLDVLERNKHRLGPDDDAVITHRISRGRFQGSFTTTDGPPNVFIGCTAIGLARCAKYYEAGLEIEVPDIRVPARGGVDLRAKTHNRLLHALGHIQIGHLRPDVLPLLIDTDGYVTESTAANIHYVVDGGLVTPPDHVALEGITRRIVMGLAAKNNIPVTTRPVHRNELPAVQEAFVTATSFCILPIRKLDGWELAPVPGPVTAKLTAAFGQYAGVDLIEQSLIHAARA